MSTHTEITQVVIHPAVGVARVGNSPSEYFLGPEVPGQVATPPGGFKDAEGRIKRQGVRFRLYGLNAAGQVVRELTADDAEVEWRVHVANRKAAWYQFLNALDLGPFAIASQKRNNSITGDDRQQLVIDPGVRRISGRDTTGVKLDGGKFKGQEVSLGELRTDDRGRLIFLGGLGRALGSGQVTTFANNDGWTDDISDGPVRATVRFPNGQVLEAEPAFVAVAPPNYGVGMQAVVTMYDLLRDQFARAGWLQLPARPSFTRDIYPIFQRLTDNQWVNQGFYVLFGHSSPSDFTQPEMVAMLSNPSEECRHVRESFFKWFRDPNLPRGSKQEPVQLPPFYGDLFGDFTSVHDADLSLTPTQYRWLGAWARGDFEADWGKLPPPPQDLQQVPLAEQPHAVDRAALEECLGGPFHPGCEITWIVRVQHMWKGPFRLNVLAEGQPVSDDFGPVLEPRRALADDGPLTASGPGTLTRWMATPWHTDTSSCLSGYDGSTYLPTPTFWAARVPNQVLSEQAYERVLSEKLPVGQRLKHLDYRQFWLRDLGSSYQERINAMLTEWSELGIVVARPGPSDHARAHLPEKLWVETGRGPGFTQADFTYKQVLLAERTEPLPMDQAVAKAADHVERDQAETPIHARRRGLRRDRR